MAKSNTFITGLIAGAVVGAVAGVLLAPKSGKETRQLLRERAASLKGGRFGNPFSKGQRQEAAEATAASGNGSSRQSH
jgi:gas vesicle protein